MNRTLFLNQSEVSKLIMRVARQIRLETNPTDEITFLVVLEGGMFFAVDLLRTLQDYKNITVETVGARSYEGQENKGVGIYKFPVTSVLDRRVIVLDEYIDSGQTMNELRKYLVSSGAASVQIATLLAKESAVIKPDFCGRTLHNECDGKWLTGYGLDDNGKMRHLKSIYIEDATKC